MAARLSILVLSLTALRLPAQDPAEAEALLAAGRFQEARRLAESVLASGLEGKSSLHWRWILGESLEREGDPEGAVAAFEALARAAPDPVRADAGLRAAKNLLRMWDAEGARATLERIEVTRSPEAVVEKQELEAIALFVAGRPKDARARFDALPKKGDAAWHYLGLIAFNGGEYAKSVECFDRALALAGDDYYNHLYRATALLALERREEARKALEALERVADTAEANQLFGRLELREGQLAEAEARFRKSLGQATDNSEAQFGLLNTLRRQGKTEEAKEAARVFAELHRAQQDALQKSYVLDQKQAANPKDPEPAEILALHYLSIRDPAAAERMAWRALRIDPRRTPSRLCLARALASVGRYREAAVHYRKVLAVEPQNPEATGELRRLLEAHARRVDAPTRRP